MNQKSNGIPSLLFIIRIISKEYSSTLHYTLCSQSSIYNLLLSSNYISVEIFIIMRNIITSFKNLERTYSSKNKVLCLYAFYSV